MTPPRPATMELYHSIVNHWSRRAAAAVMQGPQYAVHQGERRRAGATVRGHSWSDTRRTLDRDSCQGQHGPVSDIAVIEHPATAVVALDPRRSRLLAALAEEPASAATVAARVGLPRQQVGYHLRALQD